MSQSSRRTGRRRDALEALVDGVVQVSRDSLHLSLTRFGAHCCLDSCHFARDVVVVMRVFVSVFGQGRSCCDIMLRNMELVQREIVIGGGLSLRRIPLSTDNWNLLGMLVENLGRLDDCVCADSIWRFPFYKSGESAVVGLLGTRI